MTPIPGVLEVNSGDYTTDWVALLDCESVDLEFIAHARQDIPAMSARIKELEAKLAKAELLPCPLPLRHERCKQSTER